MLWKASTEIKPPLSAKSGRSVRPVRRLQGIVDILNLINGIGCRGYDFTKQGNNILLGLLDAVHELQPGFAALTIFIV